MRGIEVNMGRYRVSMMLLLLSSLVVAQSGQAQSGQAQSGQTASQARAYPVASAAGTPATSAVGTSAQAASEKAEGEQTMNWLQLQRSGAAASNAPQQASAVERELSYQRFLDSYQHPIPEYFDQESGGTVSGD